MADAFAGFTLARSHGVPVLWRVDPRFKTFRVVLAARRPLDGRQAAVSLLPPLLLHGTATHRDRTALARALERRYGASLGPASGRHGETSFLRLLADAVAGEHLPGKPDQLTELTALLADLALRPALENGAFPAERFARERANALAAARALADDKDAWARQRSLALACAGEPYGIPDHGGEAALAAAAASDPEAVRAEFLGEGHLWCMAGGALPDDVPKALEPLLAPLAAARRVRTPAPLPPPIVPRPRPVREDTERTALTQARVVLTFRFLPPADPASLCAQHVFTSLFGGGPHSRLFREVRERRSLCYAIGAARDGTKGLLQVRAGCAPAAAEALAAETLAQLRSLADGEIGAAELATTVATIRGGLAGVDDSLASRMQYTAEQWLLGFDQDPAARDAQYAAVTAADVTRAAGEVWLDHRYALLPEAAA